MGSIDIISMAPFLLKQRINQPPILSEHHPPLPGEPSRRLEHADVGVHQVGVIWVVDAAGVGQDLGLYPVPHTGSRAQRKPERFQ